MYVARNRMKNRKHKISTNAAVAIAESIMYCCAGDRVEVLALLLLLLLLPLLLLLLLLLLLSLLPLPLPLSMGLIEGALCPLRPLSPSIVKSLLEDTK